MICVLVEDFLHTIMSELVLLVRKVPLGFDLLQVEIIQLKKTLDDRLLFNLKPSVHNQRLARGIFLLGSIEASEIFQARVVRIRCCLTRVP